MNSIARMSAPLVCAVILGFALFPGLVSAASIKIMPLGDSITRGTGSTDLSGYRKDLFDLLMGDGYAVDFVGSLANGPTTFDNRHEGHSGWHADGVPLESIRPAVNGFLTNNPTDIVLLHIGTNDIDSGQAPSAVGDEIDGILDEIDAYEQSSGRDVWVILARIINRATGCAFRTQTTSLNSLLGTMVSARQNAGDKVSIVDMATTNGAGLDYDLFPNGDMDDCLHPYNTGYDKMADEWYNGLLDILPRANAGPNQDANPGVTVNLDGTGSTDSLAAITSYQWRQTAGSPTVTITSASTSRARFTAPTVGSNTALTFELTIVDSKQFAHKDSCIVNLNSPPRAAAGQDQVVNPDVTVTLDGSGSTDPGGSIATYRWAQVGGSPAVALTGTNTARATFSAPAVGSGGVDLAFKLIVTDNKGAQDEDTCIVHVNGPPLADAGGDQQVRGGTAVILDGTQSADADGSITAFEWVQIGGTSIGSLTGSNTAKARFTAPSAGSGGADLIFRLAVTDNRGLQGSDTCIVHVNGSPVASAGADRQVSSGAAVVLDGSQSNDADGLIAGYQWSQTGGSPLVSLTDAQTAQAKFIAPDASGGVKLLSFQLTITDDLGDKASDSVVVEVIENVLPVADAGEDQSVRPGMVVSLDGSGSTDPLNDVLSFQWVQTSGPIVVLSDATSIRPSFTAPSAVESEVVITFSLTVKDQGGLQSTDFCTITVSPNQGSSGSGGGGGCFIITAGSGGRKEHTTDLK